MGSAASLSAELRAEAEAKLANGESQEDVERFVRIQMQRPLWLEKKMNMACFVDGSDKAHTAYLTAKELADELTVVHVGNSDIKLRYEADLTTWKPASQWSFKMLESEKQVKDVVVDYVNQEHPGFVVVGFSGRKSPGRDPTVIGQVTDLSLRTVFCPCIVIKVPVHEVRHFVVLVDANPRCKTAVGVVSKLVRECDKLTLLHAPLKESKDLDFEDVTYLKGDASPHDRIIRALQDDALFKDVDFVCVATRPKATLGSMSDLLIRKFSGNIIVVKDVPASKQPTVTI